MMNETAGIGAMKKGREPELFQSSKLWKSCTASSLDSGVNRIINPLLDRLGLQNRTSRGSFVHGLHQLHGWDKPGWMRLKRLEMAWRQLITRNSSLMTRERLTSALSLSGTQVLCTKEQMDLTIND